VPVAEFVIAPRRTSLRPGELVRSIHLPETALTARTAFRQVSLRSLGRSAALVIGRAEPHRLVLTITAATTRPVVIELPPRPDAAQLRAALAEAVEPELYHDDVHGDPDWRQHLTLILAEQIRTELAGREGR
jgi:CO/xanthine dehydrogenase FAD-binding subunit